MTTELICLFWASVLLFAIIAWQGALTPLTQGFAWGLGSRDEPREPSVLQGRLRRVLANHIEGTVVFASLVLVAHLAGISNGMTQTGAILFVAARALFVPVYAAGIPYLRSVVWGAGTIGLIMMMIAILAHIL